MDELTIEEKAAIARLLLTTQVQNEIGAENWDLTEAEEMALWSALRKLESN